MSKISRFVLVSPGNFYVRKLTYTCTSCGHEFRLETDDVEQALQALERDHVCDTTPTKTVTESFPLIRLMRQRHEQEAKKMK